MCHITYAQNSHEIVMTIYHRYFWADNNNMPQTQSRYSVRVVLHIPDELAEEIGKHVKKTRTHISTWTRTQIDFIDTGYACAPRGHG